MPIPLNAFLTRWQSAHGAERANFLLVADVGYQIETYADFSGLGKTYTPFPDNLSHRFKLTDLATTRR